MLFVILEPGCRAEGSVEGKVRNSVGQMFRTELTFILNSGHDATRALSDRRYRAGTSYHSGCAAHCMTARDTWARQHGMTDRNRKELKQRKVDTKGGEKKNGRRMFIAAVEVSVRTLVFGRTVFSSFF